MSFLDHIIASGYNMKKGAAVTSILQIIADDEHIKLDATYRRESKAWLRSLACSRESLAMTVAASPSSTSTSYITTPPTTPVATTVVSLSDARPSILEDRTVAANKRKSVFQAIIGDD